MHVATCLHEEMNFETVIQVFIKRHCGCHSQYQPVMIPYHCGCVSAFLLIFQEVYERKRADNYWKEKNRWEANEAVHSRVENRLAAKRDAGEGGVKRNASSENYNILTLDYAKTPAGQALAFKVS